MNEDIVLPNNPTPVLALRQEQRTGLPLRMKSAELFGAAREVIIEHEGSEYRLRVTSNDKLILTK